MAPEQWLTTTEIAQELGVTRQTVSRWIREGRLAARAITSGGRVVYRVRPDDLRAFARRWVRDSWE